MFVAVNAYKNEWEHFQMFNWKKYKILFLVGVLFLVSVTCRYRSTPVKIIGSAVSQAQASLYNVKYFTEDAYQNSTMTLGGSSEKVGQGYLKKTIGWE